MSLDNIIKVNISRNTVVPSQKGFGTGAFLSDDAVFASRSKVYANLKEVTDDPLVGANTEAFASLYFSQQRRPERLYVIKKATDRYWMATITLSADLITGNTVTGVVNATNISEDFDTDHATTMANIATAIAADAKVATATVTSSRVITITGANYDEDLAYTAFAVSGGAAQAIATTAVTQYADGDDTLVNALDEAVGENDDWYALSIYSRSDADVQAVAAWVQSKAKVYLAVTETAAVITSATNDVASTLKAANYDRTHLMYAAAANDWREAGHGGGQLPKDAGSITWAFKSIKGVEPDKLSVSQKAFAHGKNCNTYTAVGGVAITESGFVSSSGVFLDIIRGTDYIQARLQENIYGQLVSADKVEMSDNGIAQIEAVIRKTMADATRKGIILADPGYTLIAPKFANLSAADKAARNLAGFIVNATFAGAVHKVELDVNVAL